MASWAKSSIKRFITVGLIEEIACAMPSRFFILFTNSYIVIAGP
jgi:hypothetical protein